MILLGIGLLRMVGRLFEQWFVGSLPFQPCLSFPLIISLFSLLFPRFWVKMSVALLFLAVFQCVFELLRLVALQFRFLLSKYCRLIIGGLQASIFSLSNVLCF